MSNYFTVRNKNTVFSRHSPFNLFLTNTGCLADLSPPSHWLIYVYVEVLTVCLMESSTSGSLQPVLSQLSDNTSAAEREATSTNSPVMYTISVSDDNVNINRQHTLSRHYIQSGLSGGIKHTGLLH